MTRLEKNQCIIDALYAALQDTDKDVITKVVHKAINEETFTFCIKDLTSKKVTTLPKLDRLYKVSGRGSVWRKMSVQSFCKLYNEGTFYIKTVNTAVAVRDGRVIMGTPNNKKGIIESFKIG